MMPSSHQCEILMALDIEAVAGFAVTYPHGLVDAVPKDVLFVLLLPFCWFSGDFRTKLLLLRCEYGLAIEHPKLHLLLLSVPGCVVSVLTWVCGEVSGANGRTTNARIRLKPRVIFLFPVIHFEPHHACRLRDLEAGLLFIIEFAARCLRNEQTAELRCVLPLQ